MPELPEVETIVRGLNKAAIKRRIKSVEVKVKKLFHGDPKQLVGKTIIKVSRMGKNILIELNKGNILAIHLKMTGQLIFLKKNQVKSERLKVKNEEEIIAGGHSDRTYDQPLPHKHTHIIITFADGSVLYYNDLRKFGWMKLVKSEKLKIKNYNLKFKIGIDALSKKLTAGYLNKICHNRKTSVKQLLLDQSKIAGIGNIYSDEILFCAGVLPYKKVGKITQKEMAKIVKYIPVVLNKSIDMGGTSRSDYRRLDGSKGNYLNVAKVYGREGLPCRQCKTSIQRIKIGQRSSHYCELCQK